MVKCINEESGLLFRRLDIIISNAVVIRSKAAVIYSKLVGLRSNARNNSALSSGIMLIMV